MLLDSLAIPKKHTVDCDYGTTSTLYRVAHIWTACWKTATCSWVEVSEVKNENRVT